MRFFALFLTLAAFAGAQLIPAGQPVPKGTNPPVVFVSGYQQGCSDTGFAPNFFAADKLLQANSTVTLFFDNCSIGGTGSSRPSLEAEGQALGRFLASLKYTDGTPITQVDIVAHSMGGLIVRSYLAGKQDVTPAVFNPPANPPIRKVIFLATPHFGTPIAALVGGLDIQTSEMSPGSQFLFDLNRWNDGTDDLRGIQAIAVAGNGATALAGAGDGVVTSTSATLGFYRPGVTRVVPDCHTANTLLQQIGYCSSGTPAINNINTDPNNMVSQILVSFLSGTSAWKSVGKAAEDTTAFAGTSGVLLQLRDMNDTPLQAIGATIPAPYGTYGLSANGATGIVYADSLTAGSNTFTVSPLSGSVQKAALDLTAFATTQLPTVVKPGPVIAAKGVVPAAGPAPFPYDVAAGAYVSIYGANLAGSTQQSGIPYPTQIGDVQVLVDGVAQQLVYLSATLINFVYSNATPGVTTLTVKNMNGQNTINLRVAAAVPSIFLLDNNRAAARNALTGAVVGSDAPLHAGDYLSLYLTGLGGTSIQNKLDAALLLPVLTIGGQTVPVLYAGRTPGYAGLDQINCQIPAGIATGAAVPIVVTSNGRSSNTATVAIQ